VSPDEISLREFLEVQIASLRELVKAEVRRRELELHREMELIKASHDDLSRRLARIESGLSEASGRDKGITVAVGWIIAAAGVLVAIAAIAISRL